MAKRVVDESSLTSVANAIRSKKGTTAPLVFPEGFNRAIASIETDPKLQSKEVIPSSRNQTVFPDTDYDGLSHVTVTGDPDLVSGNIKEGVNIFGVTGTHTGIGGSVADTSDATATEDDIEKGKTAYVNGKKITGKHECDVFTLPALTSPGSANDLASGKQFIDATGNVVIGTHECEEGITPSGTKTITTNGTHYVAEYEYAEVNVDADGDVVNGEDIEVGSLSELHAWSKYTIGGTITETAHDSIYVDLALKDSIDGTVHYANDVSVSNNTLSLVNPTTINLYGTTSSQRNVILGKYIYLVKRGGYYRVPNNATITVNKPSVGYHNVTIAPAYNLTYSGSDNELVGIVVSSNSSTYPTDGEQDGYKYVYNGTLDDGSVPVLQSKTVTPSETIQTVTPDSGYDGLSSVSVGAISNAYIGSGVTKKAEQTYTPGDAAQEIPAGVYLTGKQTINPVPTQSKTATANGTVTPDAGKYLSSVVVDVPPTGAVLPTLTTPGTANDLASGKQLIDATGNVVTGNVPVVTMLIATQDDAFVSFNAQDNRISMSDNFGKRQIVEGNASVIVSAPASEFGDASAGDVAKGKTFTSQNGLKVVGTHECDAEGAVLPTLTTPGTADDLAKGKQLIDANGNVVTGTLYEYTADSIPIISDHLSSEVFTTEIQGVPTLNIKGSYAGTGVVRRQAMVQGRALLSMFGDATAADVVAGKTFTSAAGLKVEGTMAPGGGFTVTDDGAGNVTIISSAITDNDGNVVIA